MGDLNIANWLVRDILVFMNCLKAVLLFVIWREVKAIRARV
jgi:hypothetical protein